jgi:CHAT domain-containing protein/tetratricopeptide (TPR) repeat protein
MYRFRQRVMIVVLFAVLAWMGVAQETPPPPQSPAPTHQDAPAPEPHPELKPLVEDIRTLLGNGKFQDALPKADELLQQAKAKSDKIGEAYALRFRAFALQEMRKTTPDQLPEVASVWASALALWREIGDGALQVEALLGQAYCVWRASPDRLKALVQEALQLAKGEAKRPLAVAEVLQRYGGKLGEETNRLDTAKRLLEVARAIQERFDPNSFALGITFHRLGFVAANESNPEMARYFYQKAYEIYKRVKPNSLATAEILNNLGATALDLGDVDEAEDWLTQARTLYEQVDPDYPKSLGVTRVLNNLGQVAVVRQDWNRAKQLFEQSLKIRKEIVPDSPQVAFTLTKLAFVALTEGDLNQSERYYQEALDIYKKHLPDSWQVASTLNDLGVVVYAQGKLDQAERRYLEALDIYKKLARNSPEVAHTLHNLGNVAFDRGDLEEAERYYQRALEADAAPLTKAQALNGLGIVTHARYRYRYDYNDLEKAEQLYKSALELLRRFDPNSPKLAAVLINLGNVALDRDNLSQAEQFYQEALAIKEKPAPNSLEVSQPLHNLSVVALKQGELSRAEQLLQRVLLIREKLAPNSLEMAGTLQNLAILARQQKNYPQAQRYLARALEIYETQRAAIPDPETKTAFAERYFNAYTLQAQLALDQQQPQQAALALERSRARTLAELMFTRALPVPTNAPQALKDLIAQQEQLQRDFLLLARQQRQANANDADTVQRLQAQSRQLADRQRQLDRQLREQFPAYADLLNPQPPAIPQLQAALDATTVLLYHAFADKELLIVAVSRQTVRGYRVKVDPRTLEKDLAEFQKIVAKPPLERTASERRKLLALGQRLYATLIKPAEPSLKNATTVLLCPEGALNQLPWGALIVAVDKQGRPTYWVERVALGITLSAGVYLQAKAVRPAERGVAIAAVSQYRQRQVAQAPKTAQLVRRSGRALGDLPAVKQEVAQVRRLLGKQGVAAVLEAAATPERARQMAQEARVVHFACHARADNVDPLGSGLLLAPAGSDAGLLTAAEVVSKWRLRADVVMLSACETAVGQVRRYEGMYGLARAFLFAGARSVGASLWRVEDVSTARLMGAFYRGYVAGVGKAEALRRAQVELLRRQEYSDPYYWSAFILIGAEQ